MLLPGRSLLQNFVPLISLRPSWISKGGSCFPSSSSLFRSCTISLLLWSMERRTWKSLRSVKKEILVLLPLVTRSVVSLFHTVLCLVLLMHPSLLAIILVIHSQILVEQTIILLLVLTLELPVTPVVSLVTTQGSVPKGLSDAMISRQTRMIRVKVLDVVF